MEVEALQVMVSQLLKSSAEQQKNYAAQQQLAAQENTKLIQALQQARGQQVNVDPDALRREKVSKLGLSLRKSAKIKDFKDSADVKVKDWYQRFEAEVEHLKLLNGIDNALQRDEFIECLKDKLDHSVIKRLDTKFSTLDPLVTWAGVSLVRVKEIILEEFGTKETNVSSVLLQFGPNRVRKGDLSVQEFYHKWKDQIPPCMCPEDEPGRKSYVDLINKSLFYYSLDDAQIQEELCKLKGAQDNLKGFVDCAQEVEARRRSFKDIGESSASLDVSSGITVSKWEARD